MQWKPIVRPVIYNGQIYSTRVTWTFGNHDGFFHSGIDISNLHKLCYSPTQIKIIEVRKINNGKNPGGVLGEDDKFLYEFLHVESQLCDGDKINGGDLIGTFTAGERGHAPHLHFGLYDKRLKKYIDPLPIIGRNCYGISEVSV